MAYRTLPNIANAGHEPTPGARADQIARNLLKLPRSHHAVIIGCRRVSEGLNLQIMDSIVWFEMAQHLILLTQASQRAWRLGNVVRP